MPGPNQRVPAGVVRKSWSRWFLTYSLVAVFAATWPSCMATPLSEALKSHPSSSTHLWSLYDAEELATTHADGQEITSWSDVSEYVWANHDLKKPTARTAAEKTYFAKSGVGGLPSVRIDGSHLCTDSDVATPPSGSITVIASFRFTRFNTYIAGEDPRWPYLVGQGHDSHWQVRTYDDSSKLGLCVGGGAAGTADKNSRGSISWNEDYVGVFQFDADTQTTDESIYNYWSKTSHTSRAFDFNRNLPQADKKICLGWSEAANANDKMYGLVRQIAIYDSTLDSTTVSDLRRLFFEQVPVGGYDNLIPYSGTAQLNRDYLFYNHIVISSALTIQGSVHSTTSHLTTIHQKAPKRLFEISNGATLTLKQVKIKGGSGTIERKELLKQALGYWDFSVSMRDIAGKVGDMLFVKGSATIGDGGADGKGLRIGTPIDIVRTRLLTPVSLPFTKTLVAWVTLHDLLKTGGAVISVTDPAGFFDALVFAEIEAGKWMAGSDYFLRTKNVAPSAESTTEEKLFIAATYSNRLKNDRGAIQLYRNGIKYGLPYRKNFANNYLQKHVYNAGGWGIQIGKCAIDMAAKFTRLLQLANTKNPFPTTL